MVSSLKYVRLSSYILSSVAASFMSFIWWSCRAPTILFTFASALSYLARMDSILFAPFLKKPKTPFSSVASKLRSSTTTLLIKPPTSPRSCVRTLASADSEKSAIFFWAPAPYWRIMPESRTLICWEKLSTMRFSSSLSMLSSSAAGVFSSGVATRVGADAGAAASLMVGASVSVGTPGACIWSLVRRSLMISCLSVSDGCSGRFCARVC